MNADPQELEKFSALAHRWWDPESEFKPLHQINPLRLDWIARIAELAGASALDVGCGGGILAEAMARRGAKVKGIDLSDKALKVLPKGTHDYAKFVKPSELARHCRDAGLTVREIKGMSYNPLTRAYSLGPDTGVNYLIYCVRE